jgi:hypothetical protein
MVSKASIRFESCVALTAHWTSQEDETMSKRMTEAQYDAHAATNPHAPSFNDARKAGAKMAMLDATKAIDAGELKMAAGYLAAAISLLVDE